MPKEIKISDTTSRRLFRLANDFDDNEETVIKMLLDFYEINKQLTNTRRTRTIRVNTETNTRLCARGNDQVQDYLVPVIHLIQGDQLDKKTAFRNIAEKLGVTYSTVSAQCT